MALVRQYSNLKNLRYGLDRPGGQWSGFPKFTPIQEIFNVAGSKFTSLPYGQDRFGAGYSGLPYVKTPLGDNLFPVVPSVLTSGDLTSPVFAPGSKGNLDFPIRGGVGSAYLTVTSDQTRGQFSPTVFAEIDKYRISKFLNDDPRGSAFITKQIGLQLTNPKIETANLISGIGPGYPFFGLLENTRIFNGTVGADAVGGKLRNSAPNLLEQVARSGTGAHGDRTGLSAFAPKDFYYKTVNLQNVQGDVDGSNKNRLNILRILKMTSDAGAAKRETVDVGRAQGLGISLSRRMLFQYQGGPNSSYGVGVTEIPRYVDSTLLMGPQAKAASKRVMTYDLLMAQKINSRVVDGKRPTEIQDFVEQIRLNLPNYDPSLENISTWGLDTRENRFFLKSGKNKTDRLNQLPAFKFNNDINPWDVDSSSTDDLIKFVFEAIHNNEPTKSTAIFFRAFFNGAITDNNQASYNSFKYQGRGETFYTYQGFERTMSFSFRLYAHSKQELDWMYIRLNALMSQVRPDYSDAGIMRAPLMRLTIGNYVSRMPGFLDSVNVTINQESSWDIDSELPHIVDVQVSFKPIPSKLPSRQLAAEELPNSNTTGGTQNLNQQQDKSIMTEQEWDEKIVNDNKILRFLSDKNLPDTFDRWLNQSKKTRYQRGMGLR